MITLKKDQLLTLLAPLGIAGFLYFLTVPPLWIASGLAGYYAFIAIYPIYREKRREEPMSKAWKFFWKWWYDFRKEELETKYSKAMMKYFGDTPYVGFLAKRSPEGERAGQWLVGIVSLNGPSVVYWNDKPDEELLKDPFKEFRDIYHGTPSPSLKAELEPLLRKVKIQARKKKKKEEEEIEEEERNEEGEEGE